MKKLLGILSFLAVMFVMAACDGGNTPTAVAEKAMDCMIDNDYKGFADLVYLKEKEGEDPAKMRAELVTLLEQKAGKSKDKDGEIKSYKVLSEEIAEDGNTAVVKVELTYSDGDTDEGKMKLIKTPEGDWMLNLGK